MVGHKDTGEMRLVLELSRTEQKTAVSTLVSMWPYRPTVILQGVRRDIWQMSRAGEQKEAGRARGRHLFLSQGAI